MNINKYFHLIPLWKSPLKLPVELPVELPVGPAIDSYELLSLLPGPDSRSLDQIPGPGTQKGPNCTLRVHTVEANRRAIGRPTDC